MAIRIGYKASAEQFGPRELLDFSVEAERTGLDIVAVSDHFQPWRHEGGHAPNALVWLGALAQATERVVMGTSVLTPTLRYNPSIIAQAFGTLGALAPGPGLPRRRHGGVPERDARHRRRVPRRQRAPPPPRRGGQADRAALARGAGRLRRRVLRDEAGDDLRPTRGAGADLHRRLGPAGGETGRAPRRRLHLDQRQRPAALPRPDGEPRRGRGESRAGPGRRSAR